MGYIIVIVVQLGLTAAALAIRYRIIWPVIVTCFFATLFANVLYGRPLPRLW